MSCRSISSTSLTAPAVDANHTLSSAGATPISVASAEKHAEWPPVRRHRSASSSTLSLDTSRPPVTSRHRHTQSTSSTHAPIPSPVYLARSQPIGLLSRSSSRRSLSEEQEKTAPIPRRAPLHRSESLLTFPPEQPRVPMERSRKESVSMDELAALPVCRPRSRFICPASLIACTV